MRKCKAEINAPFWLRYNELIRKEMLPYQWRVLNDLEDIIIEKERDADHIPSKKSHAIENFKIAAGISAGEHYGMVFQDSDVYKWLEAAAYALQNNQDDELQSLADSVVDLIAAAQESDGYLNTYFTAQAPERKYKRLYQSHELYCAGHFIEAAVAYYNAVKNEKALQAACRLADHIDTVFGSEEGKIRGYDGHEEVELALLRLYEVTQNKKYLELGRFFLYERGQDPEFFKKQVAADSDKSLLIEGMEGFKQPYYQVHKPVLEQDTAEGHAVRVVYMCTGMAMLAYWNKDEKMLTACKRLWKNIVSRRMYVTGAIGSTVIGESFTADYDLPNDTMYAETCASIGLIFFAHNLLKSEVKGEYADVMERALYNTVISGMALDGKHFFYVNPLEVVPQLSKKDPGKSHVKVSRPAWFGCACCPPNLARLLSSLNNYIYTVKDQTIYTDLYMSSVADFKLGNSMVTLSQETNYPWQGQISIKVNEAPGQSFGIGVRIPGWAKGYTLEVNGTKSTEAVQDGFVVLRKQWQKGDIIKLDLPMQAELWQANPLVRSDTGRAAVQRGPIVYCAEEKDNGKNLQLLRLAKNPQFKEEWIETAFGGAVILRTTGEREQIDNWQDKLYQPQEEASYEEQQIKLIPYYCWGNRGDNEMMVWLYKK